MLTQGKKFTVANYVREVVRELQQVTWPSLKDTLRMTLLVVVASSVVALYVGGLDYLFTQVLKAWL